MRFVALTTVVVASLCASLVWGQGAATYPNKTVKLVVPVTTGGPSDLVARVLADKLSTSLKQPFIVENKAGASQVVGSDAVAKSLPDGYTLLQAAANMAINPVLMKNLPYDTLKDFTTVSMTHVTPYVIVVPMSSPIKSVPELLAHIRARGEAVSYGSTGQGSPQQLATLLLAQQQNLPRMTEIQYKGSSAAHPDLIAGRIDFMIDPLAASGPHIKGGTLRGIAVTTATRNPSYPALPTAIESGAAGYEFASWGGVFAPANLSPDLLAKLNAEVSKAVNSDDFKKRMEDMGLVAKSSTPEAFKTYLAGEMERWRKVIGPQ